MPTKSALQSSSLDLSYVTVVSDLATNLTNGEWTGFPLESGDKAPEVPPDGELGMATHCPCTASFILTDRSASSRSQLSAGRVLLHFSYNVNLKMLSEALQVRIEYAYRDLDVQVVLPVIVQCSSL